ncbi:hypothetical protein Phi40:1_gp062 [Cellulophaga phage phi40:1]|uniref:Uncharacterized protein n=1 Tax=Cellulophaga phage phi38:1 TaxID=1327977 RepID=S0A0T0_9CAUD|nr:hypothetical protein Phi38:1_gp062 [Cellulophaga phage phi38:1]AGO47927.1 hypothetical protein Phi40:1_gp062 [Cellulophaga phage phi40:1]AGO48092.1 hypothetical protein Phi38:1_gp062 [Cellulophaga phage phi38:1]
MQENFESWCKNMHKMAPKVRDKLFTELFTCTPRKILLPLYLI